MFYAVNFKFRASIVITTISIINVIVIWDLIRTGALYCIFAKTIWLVNFLPTFPGISFQNLDFESLAYNKACLDSNYSPGIIR